MPVLGSITTISDVLMFLGKAASATDAERGLLQMLLPLAEEAVRDHVGYSITQQTYSGLLYPDRDLFVPEDDEYVDITNGRVSFGRKSATNVLQIAELPVRTIGEVREDSGAYAGQGGDDFATATILTAGTDYYLDVEQSDFSRNGHLIRIGATWPTRRRTVQINTMVAGYTAAELDGTAANGIRAQAIRYAAVLTVAASFKTSDVQGSGALGTGGAIASEAISTTGQTVTYDTAVNSLISGMQVRVPPEAAEILGPYVRFRR